MEQTVEEDPTARLLGRAHPLKKEWPVAAVAWLVVADWLPMGAQLLHLALLSLMGLARLETQQQQPQPPSRRLPSLLRSSFFPF